MSARNVGTTGEGEPGHRAPGLYANFHGREYRVAGYSSRRYISLWIGDDETEAFANVKPGKPPKASVLLRKLDCPPEVDPTGVYARYRGKTYRVEHQSDRRLGSEAYVFFEISDDEVDEFTDVVPRRGPTAEVSFHELDGLIRVNIRGRFAGREVQVMSIDERNIGLSGDGPASWGSEHGLSGSIRDGFRGTVPRSQVEIISVDVVDLLPKERHRKSKNL